MAPRFTQKLGGQKVENHIYFSGRELYIYSRELYIYCREYLYACSREYYFDFREYYFDSREYYFDNREYYVVVRNFISRLENNYIDSYRALPSGRGGFQTTTVYELLSQCYMSFGRKID